MRITCLCIVAIFTVAQLDAAPAPDLPKQRLAALKKRLPNTLGDWVKQEGSVNWLTNNWTCTPELRVLRRIAPERAKAVILFAASDQQGVRNWRGDVLVTVFLTYQDGYWTTERFEAVGNTDPGTFRTTFAFLMLVIDEATEKP
jgi:hypothetical protein